MMNAARKPNQRFRALSDLTRLRILHLLLGGELCVCDLTAVLGSPQPTISRHLAYLRKSGMVTARKAGVWAYYQLAPAKTEFEAALQQCIASCGEFPQLVKDARKLKEHRSSCCS